MKRGRWIGLALWIGVAACEHKDAPATIAAAPATVAATAAADASVDGGAAVVSKPATVRDAGAVGATDAAVATDARPRPRPEAERLQRALRGTRMPGLMPHGSLDRGTLIYRVPVQQNPPLMSSPTAPAGQKQ